MPRRNAAFTLVELLVVVMIIVVLIGLLLPALQGAQYEASLAGCMANLRAIAQGAVTYAAGSNRLYPYRPTLRLANTWGRPNNIVDPRVAGADDRPFLEGLIGYKAMVCPLGGQIDLSDIRAGNHGFTNYELWFGTQYPGSGGLFRTSDRLSYADRRYRVLASDEDKLYNAGTHSSHPDEVGKQTFYREQNTNTFVISRYQLGSPARSPTDTQHAFSDASVHRYQDVRWDEYTYSQRMARVPYYQGSNADTNTAWSYIPNE